MEWLYGILFVLGIPFFIGYAIGKGNSKGNNSSSYTSARLEGQREVRDYLIDFLAKQPATLQKSVLLKEMGVSETIISAQPRGAAWSPFEDEPIAPVATTISTTAQHKKETHLEVPLTTLVKTKEEHDLQNINTILYVASFLLVAAAVLFIGANVGDEVKFIGAWVVALGFYISGFILHVRSPRLRPAAVAFIGTGLALLPFAGLAADMFLIHNAQLSWFLTSILGLVLFVFATLRLKSQLLAYLSLGFVFSLTTSSVAVLQLGFVWYFVFVIIVATLLNLVSYFQPRFLPKLFLKPIDDSGQLAVPLAVFGSWITANHLPLWQEGLILAVTALHYTSAALNPAKLENRGKHIFVARWSAMISLLLFTYDFTQSLEMLGYALTLLASLQVGISLAASRKILNTQEVFWLWTGMALQLGALLLWAQSSDRALLTTGSLVLVVLTSLVISYVLRKSRYALVAVFVMAVLPFQVGKDLLSPQLSNETLAILFFVAAVGVAAIRYALCQFGERKQVAITGYSLYAIISGCIALTVGTTLTASLFIGLGLLVVAVSYIEKQSLLHMLSNILLYIGVYIGTDLLKVPFEQRILMTTWLTGSIFYALRVYFPTRKDQDRAQIMGVFSILSLMIVGFSLLFTSTYGISAAATLIVVSLLIAIEGYVYKQHEYYEMGVLIATVSLQRILALSTRDVSPFVYVDWWVATAYALAWLRRYVNKTSTVSGWTIFALSIALFVCCITWGDEVNLLNWSGLAFMGAVIMAIEGRVTKKQSYNEAAIIIITLVMQRLVAQQYDLDALVYTHWWAVIFGIIAWYRRQFDYKAIARNWLVAALVTLSVPTGLAALDKGGVYQLLFLLEHAAILVAGGLRNYRIAVLWGAIGIALSVLYWLQGYTYLLVGLLGLSLIGVAIWRLRK